MNADELRAHFRENNARITESLTHCLDNTTCAPAQKAYIQQIAQSIFEEIQEIQAFLIEQSEKISR